MTAPPPPLQGAGGPSPFSPELGARWGGRGGVGRGRGRLHPHAPVLQRPSAPRRNSRPSTPSPPPCAPPPRSPFPLPLSRASPPLPPPRAPPQCPLPPVARGGARPRGDAAGGGSAAVAGRPAGLRASGAGPAHRPGAHHAAVAAPGAPGALLPLLQGPAGRRAAARCPPRAPSVLGRCPGGWRPAMGGGWGAGRIRDAGCVAAGAAGRPV